MHHFPALLPSPSVLGPALPPGFRRPRDDEEEANDEDSGGIVGPALPPGYMPESSGSEDDAEDDNVVGPMPFKGDVASLNSVAMDFERRAQKMKDKLSGVNVSVKRMSVLVFGLIDV